MTAFEYAHDHAEDFRQELYELIRIPSVSTDPAFKPQIAQAANWLAEHMRSIGLSAEVITGEGHPLVYGEWLGAGENAPTVLVYGHYDVQPAVIEDGWDSDPFEPIERDGFMFARGSTDDKGQMFIHVKAAEALLKAEGKLPVNLKFLIEGEEEAGGEAITQFINEHADKIRADVVVISDSSMGSIEQPVIVYALRGISVMELKVTGPKQDLHSGMYGGSVHNPLVALAQIIAQFHHSDGSIAVPGFYDDVKVLSAQEREELAKVPFAEESWQAETGAPQPWGEPEYTLRERVGARPTLEITGMAGGYHGDGFKAIVPASAHAKIICRLVAHQEPDDIFKKIQVYVDDITPPGVRSEVIYSAGSPAVQVPINGDAMQAAIRAYEQGWGARPVFLPEGGSIPVVADFQSKLGVPVIMMGFGLNSDGLHGPNEHFSIEMFHKGIDTAIHFLQECAGL